MNISSGDGVGKAKTRFSVNIQDYAKVDIIECQQAQYVISPVIVSIFGNLKIDG
ncbi:hypothetical protein ACW5X7_001821 [Morganella morganii]